MGSPPVPPHSSPSWNGLQQRYGAVSSAFAVSPRAFQKLGCNRKTIQGKCRNNSLAAGDTSKFCSLSESFRLSPIFFEGLRAGAIPASRHSALCPAAIREPPIHTGLSNFCWAAEHRTPSPYTHTQCYRHWSKCHQQSALLSLPSLTFSQVLEVGWWVELRAVTLWRASTLQTHRRESQVTRRKQRYTFLSHATFWNDCNT